MAYKKPTVSSKSDYIILPSMKIDDFLQAMAVMVEKKL